MATPEIVKPSRGPGIWDIVIANGVVSPGIADVEGFENSRKYDEKEGQGAEGATNTYKGSNLAKGKITLRIWLDEHWDALPEWLDQWAVSGKTPKATHVSHPALLAGDPPILALVAEKIGKPKRTRDGDSEYTITVECTEFRPPPKKAAVATPKSAAAGGKPGENNPLAQDANDKKILQLLDQANKALS